MYTEYAAASVLYVIIRIEERSAELYFPYHWIIIQKLLCEMIPMKLLHVDNDVFGVSLSFLDY